MITREKVQEVAKAFLSTADELNEGVSNYLNGSDEKRDTEAYNKVKELNRVFLQYYCEYCGEPMMKPNLDYELAEQFV